MKRGSTKFVSLNKFLPGQQLLRLQGRQWLHLKTRNVRLRHPFNLLGGCGGGMVVEWCANCDNGDWEGNRF